MNGCRAGAGSVMRGTGPLTVLTICPACVYGRPVRVQ